MNSSTATIHASGADGPTSVTATEGRPGAPEPPGSDHDDSPGGAHAPSSPIGLYAHPEAKPPNPFATAVWCGCSLFALLHGGAQILRGQFFAFVEIVAALGSFWYFGAVHRFAQAITRTKRRDETDLSIKPPPAVESATVPVPVDISVPAPAVSVIDYVAVEILDGRPVVVVPTPLEPANPKRWLILRRATDSSRRHVLPAIPYNHAWWFGAAKFYVRRDERGFYVIPGHPDDVVKPRDVQRLVDELPVQVGEYELVITAVDFAN